MRVKDHVPANGSVTSTVLNKLAGHSNEAPPRDYAVVGSPGSKAYGVFNSLVIIATTYGNGIIPEIQVLT